MLRGSIGAVRFSGFLWKSVPRTAGRPAGRRCTCFSCAAGSRTAAELLVREAAARRIITFCGNLDEVLGGGVATGQLTEFCTAQARMSCTLRA